MSSNNGVKLADNYDLLDFILVLAIDPFGEWWALIRASWKKTSRIRHFVFMGFTVFMAVVALASVWVFLNEEGQRVTLPLVVSFACVLFLSVVLWVIIVAPALQHRHLAHLGDQLLGIYERHSRTIEKLSGIAIATVCGVATGAVAYFAASLYSGDALVIGLIGLAVGIGVWLLMMHIWRSHSAG